MKINTCVIYLDFLYSSSLIEFKLTNQDLLEILKSNGAPIISYNKTLKRDPTYNWMKIEEENKIKIIWNKI